MEDKKRFNLLSSKYNLVKYIDDHQMKLTNRHGQIIGFIVQEDNEDNVEILIKFLNELWEENQELKNGIKEIREAYWNLQFESRDYCDKVDEIIDKLIK